MPSREKAPAMRSILTWMVPGADHPHFKKQDTKVVTPRWNKGPGVEVEGSVETRAEVQVAWRPFNVVPRTNDYVVVVLVLVLVLVVVNNSNTDSNNCSW